jgi:hypothetical protein
MSELTYDITQIKEALGASTEFKTWVSEATSTLAKGHIYAHHCNDLSDMPVVVVGLSSAWRRTCESLDGQFHTQPVLLLEFLKATSKSTSDSAAFGGIMDDVSGIMESIESGSTYRIDAWYPEDETTPTRDTESSPQIVSCRIIVEGNVR